MAYETGAATDEDDLLDKLKTFCAANGWTVNLWDSDGDGYRLHMQKGDQYVNFRSTNTNPSYTANTGSHIWLCGSDGYSAGSAWNAQPGTSPQVLLRDIGGPYAAYHFFLSGDCVYVVIERTTGVFRHLCFGLLTKKGLGATESGAFVGAIYTYPGQTDINSSAHSFLFDSGQNQSAPAYRSHARFEVDAVDGWVPLTRLTSVSPRIVGPCRVGGWLEDLRLAQPNSFNGASGFWPMWLLVNRPSSYWSIIGYPPDIAFVQMQPYASGDEITIGADVWKVFPWEQRASTLTGYRGYAYRKST